MWHSLAFQVFQSGDPNADKIVLSNMSVALDRIFMVVKVSLYSPIKLFSVCWLYSSTSLSLKLRVIFQDPFVFSPYHMAIREPFDYYMFSQKYIRPLIDFRWVNGNFVFNFLCFIELELEVDIYSCKLVKWDRLALKKPNFLPTINISVWVHSACVYHLASFFLFFKT